MKHLDRGTTAIGRDREQSERVWGLASDVRERLYRTFAEGRARKGLTYLEAVAEADLSSQSEVRRLETRAAWLPPAHPTDEARDVWGRVTDAYGVDRVELLRELGYLKPEDLARR